MVEGLAGDGFLVVLLEIVIDDEILVLAQALLAAGRGAAVVEGHQRVADVVHIDAKGATGAELRVEVVLGGGHAIHLDPLFTEVLDEIDIRIRRLRLVRIDPVAAEQAAEDIVPLQQLAAETAAAAPVHHGRELALLHRVGTDRALLGDFRRRPHHEGAHALRVVLLGPAVENRLLQGVDADLVLAGGGFVAFPDPVVIGHRFHTQRQFLAVVVEHQDAGLLRLAVQTDEVDAQMLEGIGRAAHGRDVEAVPLRGMAAEHQPARTRDGAAGQQPLAEGQHLRVLLVAFPAVVHRAEDLFLGSDLADAPVSRIQLDHQLLLHERYRHDLLSRWVLKPVFIPQPGLLLQACRLIQINQQRH